MVTKYNIAGDAHVTVSYLIHNYKNNFVPDSVYMWFACFHLKKVADLEKKIGACSVLLNDAFSAVVT